MGEQGLHVAPSKGTVLVAVKRPSICATLRSMPLRAAKARASASAVRVCALIAADIERPSTLRVVREAIWKFGASRLLITR